VIRLMGETEDMARVVAYDITRLFLGPLSCAPRGIDRVDLAVARHVFADSASASLGVLPTPWGIRIYDAARVRRGLDHLQKLWAERGDADADARWAPLFAWLSGGGAPADPAGSAGLSLAVKARRMFGELAATGFAFGRPVGSALPRGAVYCNIGQIGLAVPALHGWLAARSDVAAVYMLHDVIPLEHPELVETSSARYHRRMVATAAAHADGVIVTTRHARDSVTHALAALGRHDVPTCVRRLPLPEVFAAPRSAHPALAGRRYFVVCATVEPRKNLELLLAVWRRLAARLGAETPPLVIAGSPGWRAGEILRSLSLDGALRGRVRHVAGLSSPALASLMLGSAAVLCPSLAEGFGLPLLEANALGVPVIASDIPAHREIADRSVVLLPPDDAERWAAAILARPAGELRRTPPIAAELSEDAYGRDIAAFLDLCADRKA
jgi:glycosyltransferase involved in cell wall biosynthesis